MKKQLIILSVVLLSSSLFAMNNKKTEFDKKQEEAKKKLYENYKENDVLTKKGEDLLDSKKFEKFENEITEAEKLIKDGNITEAEKKLDESKKELEKLEKENKKHNIEPKTECNEFDQIDKNVKEAEKHAENGLFVRAKGKIETAKKDLAKIENMKKK